MKRLSVKDTRFLCSGQVIVDIVSVIKELVENCLDASTTAIEISLQGGGLKTITVIDNGTGVNETDRDQLCSRYYTSKIDSFQGISSLTTFGFRGEALSSLCSVSNVCIKTKTKDETVGELLTYDIVGKLVDRSPCTRRTGTTVVISNLFARFPVRREIQHKQLRQTAKEVTFLLTQFALSHPEVRMVCNNPPHKRFAKGKTGDVSNSIRYLFTNKVFCLLEKCEFQNISLNAKISLFLPKIDSNPIIVSKYSSPKFQFLYVNKRIVNEKKINKIINSIYRKIVLTWYNHKHSTNFLKRYPFFYLNMKISGEFLDINISPNKKDIMFVEEKGLLGWVNQEIKHYYLGKIEKFSKDEQSFFETTEPTLRHPLTINNENWNEKEDLKFNSNKINNGSQINVFETLIQSQKKNKDKLFAPKKRTFKKKNKKVLLSDNNQMELELFSSPMKKKLNLQGSEKKEKRKKEKEEEKKEKKKKRKENKKEKKNKKEKGKKRKKKKKKDPILEIEKTLDEYISLNNEKQFESFNTDFGSFEYNENDNQNNNDNLSTMKIAKQNQNHDKLTNETQKPEQKQKQDQLKESKVDLYAGDIEVNVDLNQIGDHIIPYHTNPRYRLKKVLEENSLIDFRIDTLTKNDISRAKVLGKENTRGLFIVKIAKTLVFINHSRLSQALNLQPIETPDIFSTHDCSNLLKTLSNRWPIDMLSIKKQFIHPFFTFGKKK
ncbi:mismatch repair endonuclease pms2-related [Anaeramoeba flamelloides]|uniref:Mismatch repair endonuclease pms2-related n=1 Tax=Anaeramoeba flamelloides TaxID=1746091 RepID=A0AAV7ZML5_9EUKA|nr:mismatch repair endonuclease pms2-related [Anaeramoeba flamelloides]